MPQENLHKPEPASAAVVAKSAAQLAKEHEEKIQLLRERVKILRDGALLDRGKVLNPDPSKRYCWVNAKEDRQLTYQAMGWELVRLPDKTKYWKADENQHRRADLILYQIDEELFLAIQAYNMIRGLDLTGEAADEAFAATVKQHGARAFKPQ